MCLDLLFYNVWIKLIGYLYDYAIKGLFLSCNLVPTYIVQVVGIHGRINIGAKEDFAPELHIFRKISFTYYGIVHEIYYIFLMIP